MGSSQDLMACVLRLQLGHEKKNPSQGGPKELIFFNHHISLSHHLQFPTVFFSKKTAESKEIVLGSCIVYFDNVQVSKL
jgi:hypothetical protein